MKLVVVGLSLSSAWGNGHAVTFRALLRAFAARGHDVTFLEWDAPWYAPHRDLPDPDFCELRLYPDLHALEALAPVMARADAVLVGSYVHDGIAAGDIALAAARGPVGFYDIDTPVTLAALTVGDCAYLAPRQIPLYDVYFSFTGGPTLSRLEREFGSPQAVALYCSADPDLYRPLDSGPGETPTRWDLSYLGTYSADRQPGLERLLLEAARRQPQRRFVVAGPQYPEGVAWPANVERIEHLPPSEHPAFYAASRFTLNLTRADMTQAGYSPSIRLFEAASCATPLISDVWTGIETLFSPGREIVLATKVDDVLAALAMDEAARRRMGQAARARVMADHTPAERAAVLEAALQGAARSRSAPHARSLIGMAEG